MLAYPANEKQLLKTMEALLDTWKNNSAYKNLFVDDGFYPYYLDQETKILFIGRESLHIELCNYLEILHEYYKTHYIYKTHVNRHGFHRRLMKIAYGLLHGMPAWESIPSASKICDTFATAKGVSFAFMNMSKSSNTSESRYLSGYYQKSIDESLDYIKKEIEVLQPDYIISANIGQKCLEQVFGDMECVIKEHNLYAYHINVNGKVTLLMDTFHFSAIKKDNADFYTPICKAVQAFESKI